ncbi:TVG0960602 [Thermoplasma volcanium GSS1]|uniref:TVG0960602 protein n=1 Tax=Thermoplasma volcanium (strain ATCC 51530 / DSM 4299 / JCM 9571 / NBRC 15438 / GSS1) TaxID=273116 RepID=Q97A77_THEVO|nr:TVG0960602 [Thermoplasma volcanium GSS1]
MQDSANIKMANRELLEVFRQIFFEKVESLIIIKLSRNIQKEELTKYKRKN